jgi:hypothetical protein
VSAVLSGTHNFANTNGAQLIEEAYQKCGITPDIQSGLDVVSAQRSANLMLSEWINRGLNLWTVQLSMLGLNPYQNAYALPTDTSDILEATMRTSRRQLGGTPFASSGVAANAFDGNPATACTQNAPNGNIGYDYGANVTQAIQLVGVQSNATLTYTLDIQVSGDNVTWTTILPCDTQSFPVGQIIWFVIPVPTFARYYRILETGGSTLNIQELYFDTTINDVVINRISRSEYISLPQKNQTSRPNSFWVNRQINPIVYLWPTPVEPYNCMFYSRIVMMQDVGQLTNLVQMPQRFYEAFCAGLAVKLALKLPQYVTSDKYEILKKEAIESFSIAAVEDTERVPMRIFGDYQGGWGTI